MKCPNCKKEIDPGLIRSEFARMGGSAKSEKKARAARINGLKGGRRKKKDFPQ